MKGRRTADNTEPHTFQPGDYGLWRSQWWAQTPTKVACNLAGHSVTEHEDGTITVSPSILASNHTLGTWHGYLEQGNWRTC